MTGDHQSKLTLMSESLRNDGRVWVPKAAGDRRPPAEVPEGDRDYYLERKYPSFGNLAPRDISSRAAKQVCDEGRGVGDGGRGVYLDFADVIRERGEGYVREKYGNLFDMYAHITAEDPYRAPMRIYPAVHYCMGGLWVDYELMSNVPGLFVLGEANFSDHGANRLGASALMQGLADGYFVVPYTMGNYLASHSAALMRTKVSADLPECKQAEAEVSDRLKRLLSVKGKRSVLSFHRELGKVMWDDVGMARTEASLKKALEKVPQTPRGVLAERERAGRRRRVEPVAGAGQPRLRLFGVRGAALPRRPGPQRVVRRPLPRGIPDARRRGEAERRRILLRRRLGVPGRRQAAGASQGAAGI